MSAQTRLDTTDNAAEPTDSIKTPIIWRWPIVHIILAAVALLGFLPTVAEGNTTFVISQATDLFGIPNAEIPAFATVMILGIVVAAAAGAVTMRAVQRRHLPIYLHIIGGLAFILVFLTWIGAGRTTVIPLTTILAGALALSVPLVFGALCGVVCERAGIINIAIEGQLLAGAFFAAVIGSLTASAYIGAAAAPIAGILVGVLLALFSIKYFVDQIIVGVVLNVLVLGLTSFFYSTVLANQDLGLNNSQRLPDLAIPVLSEIPVIGPVLFNQTILVYLMYIFVIVLQVYLFSSRWGLRLRSVGEHPRAADTVGIEVNRTRVRAVLLGGAIAGLGGAVFTVGSGLAFQQNISAGQGFIALAAMIMGRWRPTGAIAAALLFGFTASVADTMSAIGSPLPNQFLNMLPYAITILAVAGLVGKVRPPAAENIPYKGN